MNDYWNDPPDYDYGAIDVTVDGKVVAWTEDNEVFVFTRNYTHREDGFEYVGELAWQDHPDLTPEQEYDLNVKTLTEMILKQSVTKSV